MALTETPGVPETSVHVIENYIRECFHDHELEAKYAPEQTNLNNEDHIAQLLAKKKVIDTELESLQSDNICPDCGEVKKNET